LKCKHILTIASTWSHQVLPKEVSKRESFQVDLYDLFQKPQSFKLQILKKYLFQEWRPKLPKGLKSLLIHSWCNQYHQHIFFAYTSQPKLLDLFE
jgi:hypothetical protein